MVAVVVAIEAWRMCNIFFPYFYSDIFFSFFLCKIFIIIFKVWNEIGPVGF